MVLDLGRFSSATARYAKRLNILRCSSLLGSAMVLDVVCQMEVDEKTAKWKSEYQGKTYYFCAPMCKQKFDRNPEKYVKQA